MTDRDTFAAAALTGLLARVSEKLVSPDAIRESAYAWADLMLDGRDAALRPKDAAYTGGVSASSESKPTLTYAEREAIRLVSDNYELLPSAHAKQIAATLRALLARLGGGT
jgi:hypothetical protein